MRYAKPITTSVPMSGRITHPRFLPDMGHIIRTHVDSGGVSWSTGNFTFTRAIWSGSLLSITRPTTMPLIIAAP